MQSQAVRQTWLNPSSCGGAALKQASRAAFLLEEVQDE